MDIPSVMSYGVGPQELFKCEYRNVQIPAKEMNQNPGGQINFEISLGGGWFINPYGSFIQCTVENTQVESDTNSFLKLDGSGYSLFDRLKSS